MQCDLSIDCVSVAIDLAALLATIVPVFWRVGFGKTIDCGRSIYREEIWKSGGEESTASKQGMLETHLIDGWGLRVGTTSDDFNHSLVVKQGPGIHGRATRDGCEMSMFPTGEGDPELIRRLNLRKYGFLERTDISHIDLLVCDAIRRSR